MMKIIVLSMYRLDFLLIFEFQLMLDYSIFIYNKI